MAETNEQAEVLPLSDTTKTAIVIAYLKRQNAFEVFKNASLKSEALIEKLDKDGVLVKALREAAETQHKHGEADRKLNELVSKAGAEVGKTDLTGYQLNPDTGDIFKVPEAVKAPEA